MQKRIMEGFQLERRPPRAFPPCDTRHVGMWESAPVSSQHVWRAHVLSSALLPWFVMSRNCDNRLEAVLDVLRSDLDFLNSHPDLFAY